MSTNRGRFPNRLRWARPSIAAVLLVLTSVAHAQSFQVIHSFTGGADGANPHAGLTIDAAGRLYGTTYKGGDCDKCPGGLVTQLDR